MERNREDIIMTMPGFINQLLLLFRKAMDLLLKHGIELIDAVHDLFIICLFFIPEALPGAAKRLLERIVHAGATKLFSERAIQRAEVTDTESRRRRTIVKHAEDIVESPLHALDFSLEIVRQIFAPASVDLAKILTDLLEHLRVFLAQTCHLRRLTQQQFRR